jgi:hypothetical protein
MVFGDRFTPTKRERDMSEDISGTPPESMDISIPTRFEAEVGTITTLDDEASMQAFILKFGDDDADYMPIAIHPELLPDLFSSVAEAIDILLNTDEDG